MKRSHHPEIRELLRRHPEGLTTQDIAANLERISGAAAARRALESMPDAYIDRWIKPARGGHYNAVWCVVTPPPHCPYPTDMFAPKTR